MKRIVKITVLCLGVLLFIGCKNNKKSDSYVLRLNTEGLGQVSYYVNSDNKIDLNDENKVQSAETRVEPNSEVEISARASEGWTFVEWKKDGKEYSKDPNLRIKITEDIELIAVFNK